MGWLPARCRRLERKPPEGALDQLDEKATALHRYARAALVLAEHECDNYTPLNMKQHSRQS